MGERNTPAYWLEREAGVFGGRVGKEVERKPCLRSSYLSLDSVNMSGIKLVDKDVCD